VHRYSRTVSPAPPPSDHSSGRLCTLLIPSQRSHFLAKQHTMVDSAGASAGTPALTINIQHPDATFMKPTPNHLQPLDQSTAPMLRAPVPDHIRSQLRAPSPSTPSRSSTHSPSHSTSRSRSTSRTSQSFLYLPNTPGQYIAPQRGTQCFQTTQQPQPQRPASVLNRPSTLTSLNFGSALGELTRTVRQQYYQPKTSAEEYAQRVVHLAEYGRPPPSIPAPSSETMMDSTRRTIDSTSSPAHGHCPPHHVSIQPPHRALQLASMSQHPQQLNRVGPPTATQYPYPRPTELGARGRSRPAKSTSTQQQKQASGLWKPKTRMEAEDGAFWIDRNRGLNFYGAPKGYMPANVVDEFGAWDDEGNGLRWVHGESF
jgi:hypothetical protein